MARQNHIYTRETHISSEINVSPEKYFHVQQSVAAMKSIWRNLALSNNTQIKIIIDKNIPAVVAMDTLKVQHCLNNLIENAVKSTKNGTVKIVVSRVESPRERPYIVLSVKDTGPGLSDMQLGTIFNRKPDLRPDQKPEYGVVDTGLPMTQDLVTELGGKIFVHSEVGVGSVFALLLPLETELNAEHSKAPKPQSPLIGAHSHLNILVVDDYNLNQLTIKTLLHEHVGKIYSAIHGYEALEIMRSCPVDVVLMDINMPILDGCQTTLKIRSSGQDWAGVHIFAMTADPQYHHTQLYRKIGMDGTLPKPFRKEDIVRVLQSCARPYKKAACE